ncbi:MAG TPA: WG repeat-containing protein, partial [Nitrosopumilaceae archaeon]|nr:WG repeat-containing protein [Nitrosopumilaceae archaeon]
LNKKTYRETLPCKFDNIKIEYDFESYAAQPSQLIIGELNGKKGLYTASGREILPCENEKIGMIDYAYTFLVFSKNGKKGAIDRSLQIVLPPEFDDIQTTDNDDLDTMFIVKKKEKSAIFSKKGKQITLFEYDKIDYTSHNFIAVKNKKSTILDTTGKELVSSIYDEIGGFSGEFFYAKKDGKYGYIDVKEKTIIPFMYEKAKETSDSTFIVMQNGKFGVVNIENKPIIGFQYEEIKSSYITSEGKCFDVKKGKWGLINQSEKVIIPFQYGEMGVSSLNGKFYLVRNKKKCGIYEAGKGELVTPDYSGISTVRSKENSQVIFYKVVKNGKAGLMGLDGKIVFPIELENTYFDFSEGLCAVQKDGKYGYVDDSGKLVIPFQYEFAGSFQNGKAYVSIKKSKFDIKYMDIDKKGNRIE